MKILPPLLACLVAPALSGCAALGALTSILTAPLKLIGSLVAQTDAPVEGQGSEAVSKRGSQIAARGTCGGTGPAVVQNAAVTVARR